MPQGQSPDDDGIYPDDLNDLDFDHSIEINPAPVVYDVPLSQDDRTKLGSTLLREIRKYYQDVRLRLDNCERWREDYELARANGDGPWKNSAAIRAPLTHTACMNHTTRLNEQIIHSTPPMVCEAKTEEAIDAAPQIEEALTAQLEEAEWQDVAAEIHNELPQVGNCFLRVTFEQEFQRVPRHQVDFDHEMYVQLMQAGISPNQAMEQAVKKDRQGRAKMFLEWVNILHSSGVRFKVVKFEDALILPASVRDPQDAYGIGERLYLRGDELAQGAKRGQYIQEEVGEILKMPTDAQPLDRQIHMDFQGITPEAGFTGSLEAEDPLYSRHLCYELCWQWDANGDGELEWVVVTIHESGRVVRCQYLPYHHGYPFYVMFRYFRRARELFGMGISEKLACVQDAATAILNQIIDHVDLSLNVFGNLIYEKSSGLRPDKWKASMGAPIPCDDITGIMPVPVNPLPPEYWNVYQMFKDMADLITASSNPSLGKTTDASKTLGEVQIVTGASNMIFEEVAHGVARDWARVWDQVRWLLGQYGDGGKIKYRKTAMSGVTIQGEDGKMVPAAQVQGQMVPAPGGVAFSSIPAHMMLSEVDLVPAGLKQLADMQSRTQQASLVQGTLLQHPLIGQNVDAQVVLLDEYLQALRYPKRDKIMAIANGIVQQVHQQEQLMQQQAAMAQMMGQPPPGQGVPGQEPSAPPSGQRPEDQGPQGLPAGGNPGAATGPNGAPMPPTPGGQRT